MEQFPVGRPGVRGAMLTLARSGLPRRSDGKRLLPRSRGPDLAFQYGVTLIAGNPNFSTPAQKPAG